MILKKKTINTENEKKKTIEVDKDANIMEKSMNEKEALYRLLKVSDLVDKEDETFKKLSKEHQERIMNKLDDLNEELKNVNVSCFLLVNGTSISKGDINILTNEFFASLMNNFMKEKSFVELIDYMVDTLFANYYSWCVSNELEPDVNKKHKVGSN